MRVPLPCALQRGGGQPQGVSPQPAPATVFASIPPAVQPAVLQPTGRHGVASGGLGVIERGVAVAPPPLRSSPPSVAPSAPQQPVYTASLYSHQSASQPTPYYSSAPTSSYTARTSAPVLLPNPQPAGLPASHPVPPLQDTTTDMAPALQSVLGGDLSVVASLPSVPVPSTAATFGATSGGTLGSPAEDVQECPFCFDTITQSDPAVQTLRCGHIVHKEVGCQVRAGVFVSSMTLCTSIVCTLRTRNAPKTNATQDSRGNRLYSSGQTSDTRIPPFVKP